MLCTQGRTRSLQRGALMFLGGKRQERPVLTARIGGGFLEEVALQWTERPWIGRKWRRLPLSLIL